MTPLVWNSPQAKLRLMSSIRWPLFSKPAVCQQQEDWLIAWWGPTPAEPIKIHMTRRKYFFTSSHHRSSDFSYQKLHQGRRIQERGLSHSGAHCALRDDSFWSSGLISSSFSSSFYESRFLVENVVALHLNCSCWSWSHYDDACLLMTRLSAWIPTASAWQR